MNVPWKKILLCFGLPIYGLFVLDWISLLEMKGEVPKTIVYLGSLILSPIFVVLAIGFLRGIQRSILLPAVVNLLVFSSVGPLEYLNQMSPWETQAVHFVHGHFRFLRIERQVMNEGTLGSHYRTVKVVNLAGFFDIPVEFDPSVTASPEWIAVDDDINEANLK